MNRYDIAMNRGVAYLCRTAQFCGNSQETSVNIFENATSLLLAVAAQALAVGVILAI